MMPRHAKLLFLSTIVVIISFVSWYIEPYVRGRYLYVFVALFLMSSWAGFLYLALRIANRRLTQWWWVFLLGPVVFWPQIQTLLVFLSWSISGFAP
jgi:hypothetical protein